MNPQTQQTNATGAARHARLGPSGYKSVEICPSYTNDSGSSAAADEGSMLHGILEKYNIDAQRSPEYARLDERQADMIDKIVGYIGEYILGSSSDCVFYELELDLKGLALPDTDFGTADVVLGNREFCTAQVIDYKFGWLPVDDAETNIQGWLYALGVFLKFPWANSVAVHFLQPRRDEVSTHTFARDDVPAMHLRAMTISDRRLQLRGHEFNPVASNCLWCANKAGCSAVHDMVLKLEGKALLRFPDQVKQFDPGKGLQPEDAGVLHEFASQIMGWCKDIKYQAVRLAEEGHEIAGFELKTKRGNTSLLDPRRACEIATETYGVQLETLEQFLAIAEPSLSRLEAAIAALQPRGEKGKSKDVFRKKLSSEGLLESGRASAWLEQR